VCKSSFVDPTWSLWLPVIEALNKLGPDLLELRRRWWCVGDETGSISVVRFVNTAVLLLLCRTRSSVGVPVPNISVSGWCWTSLTIVAAIAVAIVPQTTPSLPLVPLALPNCPWWAVTIKMDEALDPLLVGILATHFCSKSNHLLDTPLRLTPNQLAHLARSNTTND
jgi:hypothetical protein